MQFIESEFEMTGRRMQDIHAKGKTLKRVRQRVADDICLWCGQKIDINAGEVSKRGIHDSPCHGQFYLDIQRTQENRRATRERELILKGEILEPHSKLLLALNRQRKKMAQSASQLAPVAEERQVS